MARAGTNASPSVATSRPRADVVSSIRVRAPLAVPIIGAAVAIGWVLWPTTEDRGFALAAVAVAALAGLSVSTTGIYGGVLVPGLLLLGLGVAFVAPLSLALQLVVVPFGALDHYRNGNIRRSIAVPLIVGGSLGAVAGAYLATHVPEELVERAVAALIVAVGIVLLIRVAPGAAPNVGQPPRARITAIGGVAGFSSGISGAGWGPLGVKLLMLSNVEPRFAIGSSLVGRGFMALAAIATYLVTTGFGVGGGAWLIAIPLLGASLAGVAPGALLVTRLERRPAIVLVALLSMALALPTLLRGLW
jgi:uncharacterized membrane protein YfcA